MSRESARVPAGGYDFKFFAAETLGRAGRFRYFVSETPLVLAIMAEREIVLCA
jgi:hypothetical protein